MDNPRRTHVIMWWDASGPCDYGKPVYDFKEARAYIENVRDTYPGITYAVERYPPPLDLRPLLWPLFINLPPSEE